MIKKNIAIVTSILLFIVYRFYYIFIFFRERNILPEPDDSYFYLTEARKIIDNNSIFFSFSLNPLWPADWSVYLPYKILIFCLFKITHLPIENIFTFLFYLGTIVLPFVLIYLFKNFTKDKNNIAWLLLFLAFYSGSGAYHGFYWVGPSFFSFIVFLILLGKTYQSDNRFSKLQILIYLTLFILLNPMSVFALLILVFNSFYLFIFNKKNKQIFLKSIFIAAAGIFQYLLLKAVLYLTKSNTTSYFETPLDSIGNILRGGYIFPAWNTFYNEYIKILLPHPVFVLPLLFLFYLLIKNKRYRLLSLFLATLTFCMISLISIFGYRALEYHWPVTFIVLGQGIFEVYGYIKARFAKVLFWAAVAVFLLMVNTFNSIQTKRLNNTDNYLVDFSCSEYLLKNSDIEKTIYFDSFDGYQIFAFYGLYSRKAELIDPLTFNQHKSKITGNYLVIKKPEFLKSEEQLSKLENFLSSKISRKGNVIKEKEIIRWDKILVNMDFKRDCGQFLIYNMVSSK